MKRCFQLVPEVEGPDKSLDGLAMLTRKLSTTRFSCAPLSVAHLRHYPLVTA